MLIDNVAEEVGQEMGKAWHESCTVLYAVYALEMQCLYDKVPDIMKQLQLID
jgi:hypothetical protein